MIAFIGSYVIEVCKERHMLISTSMKPILTKCRYDKITIDLFIAQIVQIHREFCKIIWSLVFGFDFDFRQLRYVGTTWIG